jgi:hypothetical protein
MDFITIDWDWMGGGVYHLQEIQSSMTTRVTHLGVLWSQLVHFGQIETSAHGCLATGDFGRVCPRLWAQFGLTVWSVSPSSWGGVCIGTM